jgi:hypothetical protein
LKRRKGKAKATKPSSPIFIIIHGFNQMSLARVSPVEAKVFAWRGGLFPLEIMSNDFAPCLTGLWDFG